MSYFALIGHFVVISGDLPIIEWHFRFTVVPLKAVNDPQINETYIFLTKKVDYCGFSIKVACRFLLKKRNLIFWIYIFIIFSYKRVLRTLNLAIYKNLEGILNLRKGRRRPLLHFFGYYCMNI